MDTKLIVTVLVLICVNTVINTKQDYVLPVPGCVVVELDTHTECFTHSNGATANPVDAEKICASKGGRLAIIQHEKTWKSLIATLLKDKTARSVWLGFTVLPNTVQLLPDVDLTNMSVYWTTSKIASYSLQQWIFTHHSHSWDWRLSSTTAIDYLCQYNVTKLKCSITDIEDPRIIVNSCLNETLHPNNSTVEVKCSPGYYLNSSQTITCRNGVWDKPLCVPGCTPPKPKNHAMLISDKTHFNVGDTVFYVCEDNFYNWRDFGKTHFTRTCQNDSTWSDEDARCSLKRDYTTITINASEISSDTITLECELLSTEIMWIRNGKEVFNSSKFTVSTHGNLLVNSNAENIDGFYMCQSQLGENFQVGKKAYRIFGRKECPSQLESFRDSEGLFREGESIILNCPQDSDDRQIKWFKNENEITSNEHHNIIVGGGLVLKRLTQTDKGTYRCQTTYSFKSNSCKFNISYHLNIMVSAETVCGIKIGNQSNYHQPWFVILQHEDEVSPFCFGALLNQKWVVTSAFCLSSLRRKKAITGVYAQLGSPETRQKFSISSIKIHPKYRNRRNINDVGLIQLAGYPVKFNDDIVPICISLEDIGNIHKCENSANLKGTLTGWSAIMTGKIYDVASIEKNLASKNVCRSSGQCGFAEDKFCIKHSDESLLVVETATGDYGSPFVVTHNQREYLLGIFTGGENDHYDYFTSIFLHYDWIKRNIN